VNKTWITLIHCPYVSIVLYLLSTLSRELAFAAELFSLQMLLFKNPTDREPKVTETELIASWHRRNWHTPILSECLVLTFLKH